MSNKPVAWLIQTKTTHQFTFKEPTIIPLDAGVIPLYTHPVKELKLTNDEIREIGDECIFNNNGILNWIEFAKAILRKAQEQ